MVGPGPKVTDPVLLELRLEPRGPPPVGVLAPVVRKHLLRDSELPDRPTVDLEHVLRGLAPEYAQARHVPRVVVEEADQVGVAAPEPEREDVALPKLVGTGTLEEPRLGGRTLGLALRRVD